VSAIGLARLFIFAVSTPPPFPLPFSALHPENARDDIYNYGEACIHVYRTCRENILASSAPIPLCFRFLSVLMSLLLLAALSIYH